MPCLEGAELFRRYKTAINDRELARDILLTSSARRYKVDDPPFEDLMFLAKQRYSDAFVAWVTHRGSCTECEAAHGKDDLAQFASV